MHVIGSLSGSETLNLAMRNAPTVSSGRGSEVAGAATNAGFYKIN